MAYNWDDEGGNPKQGWTDVVVAMVQDAYNRWGRRRGKGGAIHGKRSDQITRGIAFAIHSSKEPETPRRQAINAGRGSCPWNTEW